MEDIPLDLCNIINEYKDQIETFQAHKTLMIPCLDLINRLEISDKTHRDYNILTTVKMFRSNNRSKSLYFYSVSSWCACCGNKVITDYFDFELLNETPSNPLCLCEHFDDDFTDFELFDDLIS